VLGIGDREFPNGRADSGLLIRGFNVADQGGGAGCEASECTNCVTPRGNGMAGLEVTPPGWPIPRNDILKSLARSRRAEPRSLRFLLMHFGVH
jgi:hypothetical protein